VVIEGAFGLGESVVSGSVSPDRYVVDKETRHVITRDVKQKELSIDSLPGGGTVTRELDADEAVRPVLDDDEVQELVELAVRIEEHYGSAAGHRVGFRPGRQGLDVAITAVTATGAAGTSAGDGDGDGGAAGAVLLRGLGAAPGAASGIVRRVATLKDAEALSDGEILVTHMTAPDWVPLMRRAAAIVTDSGGMTCHAAIVSRELGIPCLVGTGSAMTTLRDGELVTIDATHGTVLEGRSAAGPAVAAAATVAPSAPVTATKLLVNLSEPSQVERAAALPVEGSGCCERS